jgi:hypothetical protein
MALSGFTSIYTVWKFFYSLYCCKCYPDDGRRKSDRNMLVIFTYIPCILILSKFFYPPTDTRVNYLKNNFKIYIKTAPTCFGTVTPSSGSALFVLAKVTVVKIVNYDTSVHTDVF